jgi:hypothetical protein
LENLAEKSCGLQGVKFNKFQFFFEFLQFGADNEKLVNKRRDIIKSYILANNIDCYELVMLDLLPSLKELTNDNNEFSKGLMREILALQDKLNTNESKNYKKFSENASNRVKEICFTGNKKDTLMPSGLTNQDLQHIVSDWLLSFLKLGCFSEIFCYDKINRSNNSLMSKFINFGEVTNPSLPYLVMNDLAAIKKKLIGDMEDDDTGCEVITQQNIKNKINKVDLLEQFLIVYGNIGSEFKLKYFFIDYLLQFMELDELDNKKYLEIIKYFFLKMCHEFYILGLISRKRAKGDMFVKNYFQIANYYKN